MKDFVDKRSVTNAMIIGGKWDKGSPIYLAKQNRPVAALMQEYVAEALQKVGYRIEPNPAATTPTLEGELTEFWLKDDWGGAVCTITLVTRLRKGPEGAVLWEYAFHSKEDDWVIIPNAMVAAINTLLKSTMDQFSQVQFSDAVNGVTAAK